MNTAEERFWEKVGPHNDPNSCWLWLAGCSGAYGCFRVEHRHVYAHRFAYELLVGPIPEGMTIDHVKARGCANTLCVNPAHLEVVTLRVNILRGTGPSALAAKQTACIHGHSFDEKNTWVDALGFRHCRTCQRDSHARQYQLKKAHGWALA